MRNTRKSGQILKSKKNPRPTGKSGRGSQANSNIFRQVLAWVTESGERLDVLVGLAARTRDSNSGKELPAGSARPCTGETRHGPQQGLHGMRRWQIDREASCIELIVPLGVFNRR